MCEECMGCLMYDEEGEGSYVRHIFLSAKDLLANSEALTKMLLARC